ncbi:molybdate ABC transporter substrate-binding protein [bacterium]|nr:molybdate ABC transporter substrate-binding protein [bacterium]
MKKLIPLILILGFIGSGLNLQACELYWYLAASMSKPGKEIVKKWNQQPGMCHLYLILGGSGQILSQLYMAKKGDLYTPASEGFLEKAKDLKIVKHQQLLLRQTPVFGLSKSGEKQIKSFSDLTKQGIKIALGNPKTMALGKTYLGIEKQMDAQTREKIRFNTLLEAINISQVVNYLLTNAVDAGIVFDTTATASGISYIEIPPQINAGNKAYMVTLSFSTRTEEVKDLIRFIYGQKSIFKQYGFSLSSPVD